ncbi:SAM-dependent methyltransferase [bacterium]|nr:SAM-dependent methyltransferase [bacterium]
MNRLPSSFRDPSGFIFKHEGRIMRQIQHKAETDYELLMSSGLYELLVEKKALIPHEEVENVNPDAYKTILPQQLDFISYPYEWSFEQLKDAALLTLRVQLTALKKGLSLKDASAYNVQFVNGKAMLIDTLSFERYEEGSPWVAYRQFCQHFYAPLLLASIKDIRLNHLFHSYIDGIPLDLASKLLPWKTRFNLSIASHIHWHAKAQGKHANKAEDTKKKAQVSSSGLRGILKNLESSILKLSWEPGETEWGDYYNNTNYSEEAHKAKFVLVKKYIDLIKPETLWDLGANDGTFSKIAADQKIPTIAFDIDPIAVNQNYRKVKEEKQKHMLPLMLDLTNPSPALGWAHKERDSLEQRGPAGCIMALALVHHLAISNNLPLEMIAEYFSKLGQHLIIEFVPKTDSKVKILLATREDIFPEYTEVGFEDAFSTYFDLMEKSKVEGSERTLYCFKSK